MFLYLLFRTIPGITTQIHLTKTDVDQYLCIKGFDTENVNYYIKEITFSCEKEKVNKSLYLWLQNNLINKSARIPVS